MLMISKLKKMPAARPASRMVEDIVGCKWSLAVLGAVRLAAQAGASAAERAKASAWRRGGEGLGEQ